MSSSRVARLRVDPLGALLLVVVLAGALLAGTCSSEKLGIREPVQLLRETPPGDIYVFEIDDLTCVAWANRGQTGLSCLEKR